MVLAIVLISWAVASVLTAVLFAAIGRGAAREDEALGYTGPELRTVPEPPADEPTDAREAVTNSASR